MKPQMLKMSAFGPYADEVEIPFSQLNDRGLFLITGDTGAGKTTIFDGIVYALYGEASGSSREISSMRSDFAAPDTETYVELEFLHRGTPYRIRRSPDYERPGKRDPSKRVKVPGDAEMTGPDGTVITGVRQVTAAVERLLGIDRDQFSQIVMIAQGDFLHLLHANTNERREIFRKIFHTDSCLRIQDMLRSEKNRLKADFEEGVSSILQYADQLSVPEDLDGTEMFTELQQKNDYYQVGKVEDLCRAGVALDRAQAAACHNIAAELSADLNNLNREIGCIRHQVEQKKQMETAQQQLESLKAKQVTWEGAYQEAAAQEPHREALYRELLRRQDALPAYDGLEAAESAAKQYHTEYAEKCSEQMGLEASIRELEEHSQMLLQELAKRETAPVELEKATAVYDQTSRRIQELEHLDQLYQEWRTAEFAAEQGRKDAQTALDTYQTADRKRMDLETRFLQEQAGILAMTLQEGVPCPVCGAIHHPSPAECAEDPPSQDALEKAKKHAAELGETAHEKSRICASLEAGCALSRQNFQRLSEQILGACDQENIPVELQQELHTARRVFQEQEQKIHQLTRDCEQQKNLQMQQTAESETLAAQREALEQLRKEAQDLRNTATQADAKVQTIRDSLEFPSRSAAQKAAESTRQTYESSRKSMEEAAYARENGLTAIREMEATVAALQESLHGERTSELADMEARLVTLESRQKAAQQEHSQRTARANGNEQLLDTMQKREKTIQDIQNQYLLVERLSDTANGELKGHQRLAFESYMQAAYFDRIIDAANQRLDYMTSGRYELVRQTQGISFRGQSGLELNVLDHYTGKERSVKTLSGGESFKASLSLALGLSDVVQQHAGGVEIDAMFVDEGFGSLDTESREQAIAILNGLTGGERMVGIISHVAEFRESIDTQIVITKGTNGSSIRLQK